MRSAWLLICLLLLMASLAGCAGQAEQRAALLALDTKCPDPPEACDRAIREYLSKYADAPLMASATNVDATGIMYTSPIGYGIIVIHLVGGAADDVVVRVAGDDAMQLAATTQNVSGASETFDEYVVFAYKANNARENLAGTFSVEAGGKDSGMLPISNPHA